MSRFDAMEWDDVCGRVSTWPAAQRIALARRILDSLPTTDADSPPSPRGVSAAEIQAIVATDGPPPDDETVERWVDEHRMEKSRR